MRDRLPSYRLTEYYDEGAYFGTSAAQNRKAYEKAGVSWRSAAEAFRRIHPDSPLDDRLQRAWRKGYNNATKGAHDE